VKQFYVYLLANAKSRKLYIGVTNSLERRVWEHRHGLVKGFAREYHIASLVYYEITNDVHSAIRREKELKGWLRRRKVALIESTNPTWRDLAADWYAEGTSV